MTDDNPDPPTVPALLVHRASGNAWDVDECPHCGRAHRHGADPSVILMRTESGATFRIGERALAVALVAAEGADAEPDAERQ